jgi:hypothetical protein
MEVAAQSSPSGVNMRATTVAELLEKLKDVPPDAKVILEDSEYGNCPLKEVYVNFRYAPVNSWHGDVYGPADEVPHPDDCVPCIVLSS